MERSGITCHKCKVLFSGPTDRAVQDAYQAHEKEVHNVMSGQQFYERFVVQLNMYGTPFGQSEEYMQLARKAAGLE